MSEFDEKAADKFLFEHYMTGSGNYKTYSPDFSGNFFIDGARWQYSQMKEAYDQCVKERDDLRYLHDKISERVMPGTTDSTDAMMQIVRERDELKIVNEKYSEYLKGMACESYDDGFKIIELEKKLTIALEALKRITRTRTRDPLILEYRQIARDAVKQIEGK